MAFSYSELLSIPPTLSQPRFDTYLQARGNDPQKALALYQWNLKLSVVFFLPLHLFEISLRNAVAQRLDAVYGAQWPWDAGFIRSLPNHGYYAPRQNLLSEANKTPKPTTGKVIAELKFIFWEKMFTSNHHGILWRHHIHNIFPKAPHHLNAQQLMRRIHDDTFEIRQLRNRIAHHEPIFSWALRANYQRLDDLITWRDPNTGRWMNRIQEVTKLLAKVPT